MSEYKEIFTSSDEGLSYELEPIAPVSTKAITLNVIKVDDATGKISISLGSAPKTATGTKVLLDKITLSLLTTLGESAFNPGMGSFVTALRMQNNDDALSLYAKLSSAISIVQNQILAGQANQTLNKDQILKELKLGDVYKDPEDPTTLLVEVLVVTESNEEYILTV